MNKYVRVMKPREMLVKDEEEIRVTAAGSVSAYVSRAAKLYNDLEKQFVTITATGNALTKAVTTAEVIKRRFRGLHQITKLGTQEIVDEYEPLEEGLDRVTDTRSLPFIEIKLSKEPLDTSNAGYQEPLDESKVTDIEPDVIMQARGRGRGRGKGRGKGGVKGGWAAGTLAKGKGKGKVFLGAPKGTGKAGKGAGLAAGPPLRTVKGKGKGKGAAWGAPMGKGTGAGVPTGKGAAWGAPTGQGAGWAAPKGKGKGKSAGYGSYAAPSTGGPKSKGKGSAWDTWNSGDDEYGSGGYGSYGGGATGKGKPKGAGKGKWQGGQSTSWAATPWY